MVPQTASVTNRVQAPLAQALLTTAQAKQLWTHVPGHVGLGFVGLSKASDDAACSQTRGFLALQQELGLSQRFLSHDLTELDGLDDLANPTGCIAEAQDLSAEALNAKACFYLTQGSTVGLQAALLAAFQPGDAVLVPRNAHRSVLSGLILTDLRPIWLLPERLPEWDAWCPLGASEVEAAFVQHPEAKGVVLLSPTYEGLAAPVEAISQVCQRLRKALIVDEAHGALFPYSDQLPASALQATGRVDAVIQSLHKTAGSLTQTAVLWQPKGSCVETAALAQAVRTLHTTSPSFPLLASLDLSLAFWRSPSAKAHLQARLETFAHLREGWEKHCSALELFSAPDQGGSWQRDPCRFYLRSASGWLAEDGWALWAEEQLGLTYEALSPRGALYIAHVLASTKQWDAFTQALEKLDAALRKPPSAWPAAALLEKQRGFALRLPEQVLTPRAAFFAQGQLVGREASIGRIAKETVVHCPPGIPELLPGERITSWHLEGLPEKLWVVD